jgi:hypothetical protein
MARRSTLRLPLALAAALLVPACGEDPPTASDVARAGIVVNVNPTPIPPSFNTLTGVVSVGYRVVITEVNGLGGEIVFVAAQVFDPDTGFLAIASSGGPAINYYDGADLIVFVGKKRIDPGGTLEVPQTMSYVLPDARINSLLTVNVQMKDDHENLINQSVMVKVE